MSVLVIQTRINSFQEYLLKCQACLTILARYFIHIHNQKHSVHWILYAADHSPFYFCLIVIQRFCVEGVFAIPLKGFIK